MATPRKPTRPSRASLPRGRGRPADDGSDRRGHILDAAIALFAQAGIAATSFAAIARRAGVTPALVHYYFSDRDALVDALVAERLAPLLAGMAAALADGGDAPLEPVRRVARAVVAAAATHPWFPALWVREVLCEGGLLRERLLVLARGSVTKRLREHIVAAQAAGSIRRDLDPRLVVVSVIGLTVFPLAAAPIWRRLLDGADIPDAALADHAIALLERGLEPAR